MEHRNWNKNNIRTSLLGYGCMRFPTKADGTIDEERAEALLNTAKAAGVNYFDTAYPYHNGQSEPFVGRVIAKWDRSSFYLATKMPLWKCKSLDDAKRIFEEQLQRLGVDYIDFYLLAFHSFGGEQGIQHRVAGLVLGLVLADVLLHGGNGSVLLGLVLLLPDAGKLDFQFMIPPVDEVDALLAALVLLVLAVQHLVHGGKLAVQSVLLQLLVLHR